jgi:peptidoglycan/LPS O-acetylase OafA/YrhL
MSRKFKPIRIKGAFWISSITIIVLLSMPYIGDGSMPWKNGLYDSVCTILIFPVLVYSGASGSTAGRHSSKLYKFLGDISYPLYVVHYPFMYLFYSYLWSNGNLPFSQTWHVAVLLFVGNVVLAYASLKLYDEPVRKFLTKRFLLKNK